MSTKLHLLIKTCSNKRMNRRARSGEPAGSSSLLQGAPMVAFIPGVD